VATALIGVIALALAWTTFRIERFTARQRQIDGAHALMTAVRQALVSRRQDGEAQLGWGQIYFSNIYVPGFKPLKEIGERAIHMARMGRFDQVLVVPTEPLEKLATTDTGGDLISAETVAAANHGLWRVHIFNQLVYQQTVFNAVTHSELRDADTTEARKEAIAQSAKIISQMLHQYGIGDADAPGGWYDRLKTGLRDDVSRLEEMREKTVRRWRQGVLFAAVDVGMAILVGATIVVGVCDL
jgi:hypothetical protein